MSVVQRRGTLTVPRHPLSPDPSSPQPHGAAPATEQAEPLFELAAFVLALPLVPSALIALAALFGSLAGCDAEAASLCRIGAVDLGQVIRISVEAAWDMPVFVGLPMLIATVLVHRSTEDLGQRFFWGALMPVACLFAVLAAPVAAVHFADHDSCRITEAGRGLCRIYGVELGDNYATSAMVPWLLIPAVPAAVVYALGYLGFVRVAAWARRLTFSRSAASMPGSSRSVRA